MKPQVSVVIPTYNCIEFLPTAINSVLQQGISDIEILVMDDGSSDGTFVWLEQMAAKHHQLYPFKLDRVGVVTARNKAIELACSDYIAFLDADDYWQPNKLFCQLNWHKVHDDTSLSFTNYMHFKESGEQIIDCFAYWKLFDQLPNLNRFFCLFDAPDQILATNMIGTSSVIARKDALIKAGGFNPDLKSASDWDMWLKLAQLGQVAVNPTVQMQYLMRAGSITSNRLNRLEAMRSIITQYQANYPTSDYAQNLAWSRLEEGYGEYYREKGQASKALHWDWASIRHAPEARKLKHLGADIMALLRGPNCV